MIFPVSFRWKLREVVVVIFKSCLDLNYAINRRNVLICETCAVEKICMRLSSCRSLFRFLQNTPVNKNKNKCKLTYGKIIFTSFQFIVLIWSTEFYCNIILGIFLCNNTIEWIPHWIVVLIHVLNSFCTAFSQTDQFCFVNFEMYYRF
jgi:hypothetical protein